MHALNDEVLDDNGNRVGIITGVIEVNFWAYINEIDLENGKLFKNYNEKYPGWREKPMICVWYDKPRPQLTLEEFANHYGVSVYEMPEKLYTNMVSMYWYVTMPWDSVNSRPCLTGE